jgi:hypothetical protein
VHQVCLRLPSTVCPQLFALNCLPSTVCPQLFALYSVQALLEHQTAAASDGKTRLQAELQEKEAHLQRVYRDSQSRTQELLRSLQVCICLPLTTVRPQLLFALNYCLPSTTVRPQLLSALNYCRLPSTTVCPQLLFALN